jgi:hypothetical protein
MTRSPVQIRRALSILGVAAAALWTLMRSGTGIVPGADWHFAAVAIWPRRPLNPDEGYLADSPLGILVFRGLGLHTLQQFLILSAAAIVLSMAALAIWAYITTGSPAKWQATRISLLAPIGAVLLAWIGMYDPFTALAWAAFLFAWASRNRILMALAGVLLGFQHFEHAFLGVAALTLTWVALRAALPPTLSSRNPTWVLPGLVVGKLILIAVFWTQGTQIGGRNQWLGPYIHDWSAIGANVLPLLLWSLFAGWWAIVSFLALDSSRKQRVYLAAAFLVGLSATFLSGDRPRVFVIVLLPSVALAGVAFARQVKPGSRESRVIEAVVWLGTPILFWGKDVANANIIDLTVTAGKALLGN